MACALGLRWGFYFVAQGIFMRVYTLDHPTNILYNKPKVAILKRLATFKAIPEDRTTFNFIEHLIRREATSCNRIVVKGPGNRNSDKTSLESPEICYIFSCMWWCQSLKECNRRFLNPMPSLFNLLNFALLKAFLGRCSDNAIENPKSVCPPFLERLETAKSAKVRSPNSVAICRKKSTSSVILSLRTFHDLLLVLSSSVTWTKTGTGQKHKNNNWHGKNGPLGTSPSRPQCHHQFDKATRDQNGHNKLQLIS